MKKFNYIIALTVIACLFHAVSYAQMRDFVGSNGRIIEAAFLGFDEATQIVKLRLKDGREQNVKLDLFAPQCQQWIKSGGKDADNPFGDNPFGGADAPQEQEGDWEWLFDGRSLNGWEGDTNVWQVNQNERALVNTGRGNLFTTKQYDNFIIQLVFRYGDRADNGLLLRVDDAAKQDVGRAMKIQINDDRPNNRGRDHNGCVFETLHGPKPHTHQHWNFMEIIVDGSRITTYIEGMKVVDDTLPQDKPFSSVRSGRIGFTGNGGTTAIRYIRIKPLKAGEDGRTSRIAANDSREGFTPIFDGRTLNGWQGDRDKFRAENNMLIQFNAPGRLETVKEYRNFVMRLEFRLSRHADNGVNIRKSNSDNGLEIQVADDDFFEDNAFAWGFHGSIFPFVPARRGSLNAVGQWNTMEITADRSMIRVVVNDQIVVNTDVLNIHGMHNDLRLNAVLHNKSGHIMFGGNRGQVDFRNIRIKELP